MVEYAAKQEGPRILKTHLTPSFFPTALLNPGTKFIILVRNPKDCLVAYYHHYKFGPFTDFDGTFEDFMEIYKAKQLRYGDWFQFYEQWWSMHDDPRVCSVKYEDLKKDLPSEILRLAEFMSVTLTGEQVDDICRHVSFTNMKKNPAVHKGPTGNKNPAYRKGVIGDWKNCFTPELQALVDNKLRDHELLKNIGLCDDPDN